MSLNTNLWEKYDIFNYDNLNSFLNWIFKINFVQSNNILNDIVQETFNWSYGRFI